jgi:translocation and assembly module TamB
MRRLFHSSWIALFVLLLAALSAFYWVGFTESGLHRLAAYASRRIGPVTMRIEGVRGTLSYGADVEHFTLDHRRVHIEADHIRLNVSMISLFALNVHVARLTADRLLIHVLPVRDEVTGWQPHFLRGPMTIEAPSVQVRSGTLIATNDRRFDVTDVQAGGLVRAYSIRIYGGHLDYSGLKLQAEGEVKAASPIGLAGSARFTFDSPGQPGWLANASFDGDLDRLPVRGALTQPLSATFEGAAVKLTSPAWNWSALTQVRQLDLRAWGAGNALGVMTGTLTIGGDRNGLRASGALTPPGLKAGPVQVTFAGSYANRVLTARTLQFVHRPSGSTITASGDIGIVPKGPRLDLQGRWQNFRWPLQDGDAPVHSSGGEFNLHGLRPFALRASGGLRVQQLAEMRFTASGQLATDRLLLEDGTLQAWGGQASVQGEARWGPEERWQLSGQMRALRLEQLRSAVPGLLTFRYEAEGNGFGSGGTLLARVHDLGGTVHGQRASGQGQVERAGDDWRLSNVRLQLGTTRINADGRVGAHNDLRFDIDTSDLALLRENARGQLRARGSIRDGTPWPALQLDATGANIVWDRLAIGAVNAKINYEAQDRGRADVSLMARMLRVGERSADSVQVSSAGTAAAHRVTLQLRAPQLQLSAAGDGALNGGVWQWVVSELRAEDGRDLQLALESPATLRISATDSTLERLCLHGTQSRICGTASDHGGARNATVNAENLPLAALTAGLSDATQFDGTLGVEARASADADMPWHGQLRAQLRSAVVRHRLSSGRSESFNLGTGDVSGDLDANELSVTAALDAGDAGKLTGQATARPGDSSWQTWPLSGRVQLATTALGLLDSYLPQIDRASGRVTADLQLAGTLGAPLLNGSLNVRNAVVDAYQVNLAVRELNLDATLHDNVLDVEGSAAAGVGGKARFSGNLKWQDKLPYGDLHVTGESLLVVNIPEAKVYASPDVDLRLTGRRIDVTGTIELPYARLEQPDTLASAMRVSGDEVLVKAEEDDPGERTQVYSNVTLKLGDRVTINTTGLQGRLSGSITSVSDESGFNRGTGELNVEEGKYTAYGRKLDITRGRLIYKNSPLGDPGVDLRAVKQFPDITAGVNVRGSLAAPSVTFFSDPTIPQSQIVSLLLAGGSLDSVQNQATSGDQTARSNAASASMLLQGSAILAQQFGNRLGTDVSVEQNLQNDTSLVLGRYLSPRLYISYGIGLAEAINTVKMSYTIGDKWTLRTEAGQARSADLVYTIKK